jgi:hypothetical protein
MDGGVRTIIKLPGDLATFIWLILRPDRGLAVKNLFLRKQSAMYQERKFEPYRPDTPTRIALALLSRLFNWRDALVVVQPRTFVRLHRQKANSLCEHVIGTTRRERLDFLIPLTENHLRLVTKTWVTPYDHGRSHSSLGPGIPDPPVDLPVTPHENRHRVPRHLKILAHPVLGGLHHEYGLLAKAA